MAKPKPDPLAVALQGVARAVLDASLAIDALIGEPTRKARALRFFGICNAAGVVLIVPPNFASETDTAVIQSMRRGDIAAADVAPTLAALDALTLDIALDAAELNAVRQRARQIADELQQPTVYDATYAALAEARGCNFWTADKRFANAAKQVRRQSNGTTVPALPVVRSIADY
jgi:predicted nucleic acid-binding protein